MSTKSKFFRVAVEGATTDGRNIECTWIEQMAKNFNRATYGARIWLEHYRGVTPESPFKAYGDVLSLKAEEIDINGQKKLALFAQIQPLPELVAMSKAGQKIYTSIEINPKFSDTGEAYLTGLAVTDSPASLGTDILSFAQQKPNANPFAARKSDPSVLFSEAIEAAIQFEETTDDSGIATKFSAGLKALTEKFKGKGKTDDARFSDVLATFEQFGEMVTGQAEQLSVLQKDHAVLGKNFAALQTAHTELIDKLEIMPSGNHTQRPNASGGKGIDQTDC